MTVTTAKFLRMRVAPVVLTNLRLSAISFLVLLLGIPSFASGARFLNSSFHPTSHFSVGPCLLPNPLGPPISIATKALYE